MRTIEVKPVALKIERRGVFGDYEVFGWRYVDDISLHVKVWLAGHPRDWLGYTMTSGQCQLNILNQRSPTISTRASDCQLPIGKLRELNVSRAWRRGQGANPLGVNC